MADITRTTVFDGHTACDCVGQTFPTFILSSKIAFLIASSFVLNSFYLGSANQSLNYLSMSLKTQCFNPDGSVAAADQIPCSGGDDTTHCCQQGATCLSNGLCLFQSDSSLNTGTCTDASWNADACFQRCLGIRIGAMSTVYKCSDNQFCCSGGANATSCCNDPGQNIFFKIPAAAQVENGTAFVNGYNIAPNSAITAALSTSITSASASQPTTSTHATDASGLSSDCSSDKTKVGVGVGVGMGVPLIALVLLFLVLWLRERRQKSTPTNSPSPYPPETYQTPPAPMPMPMPMAEADTQSAVHEMGSSPVESKPMGSSPAQGRPVSKKSWGYLTGS